ncbi:hypothetical protein [Coleofasciculus sp. FACHB-129]|uniref:hypothetical protein n=1 Tax=Coleofasciculus sp. FACHB-129 TaxID=2692785 RepID=UPI0019CB50BD|nr:hypothetical protein [Coleofasciculus sp. FACHB-129]MBD1893357.1 hypothetical protein [Coleofasciculus sp. FACHB-129]
MNNSIYSSAIADVGEVLHRMHEQLTDRFLVQIALPQGTGVNQIVASVVGRAI